MRIHILACRVFTREFSALIPECENDIDVTWLPQGLHDTPVILHNYLEEKLEEIYMQLEKKQLRKKPDVIVLGYGLCAKSIVGLTAKEIPLVVPRTDDCIGVFLGSQKRYLDYFHRYQGTFWLNAQWVADIPDIDEDYDDRLREEYMEQYDDEDTVDYLMEMHDESLRNYKYVGFIGTDTYNDDKARETACRFAERKGLEFFEKDGDRRMLNKIFSGDFGDETDFLTVPPGYRIEFSNGPEKIIAVK